MGTHSSSLAWETPWTEEPGGLLSVGLPRGGLDLWTELERVAISSPGDLPRSGKVPLRGEGSCGGGGAPRDSAGSAATEEGLT